jgi:hypothetical protein
MPGVISTFRDGDYSNVVDKRIGDAYLVVKNVQENLPAIITVSEGFAAIAANSAAAIAAKDAADADVVLTNADVVLTHADVVTTTAQAVIAADNAALTAADRVQTGLDAAATAGSAAEATAQAVISTDQATLSTAAKVAAESARDDAQLSLTTLNGLLAASSFAPFTTQAALLASTPAVNPSAAKALDTKKVWYWNGAWVDTGLSELDLSKQYTDVAKGLVFTSETGTVNNVNTRLNKAIKKISLTGNYKGKLLTLASVSYTAGTFTIIFAVPDATNEAMLAASNTKFAARFAGAITFAGVQTLALTAYGTLSALAITGSVTIDFDQFLSTDYLLADYTASARLVSAHLINDISEQYTTNQTIIASVAAVDAKTVVNKTYTDISNGILFKTETGAVVNVNTRINKAVKSLSLRGDFNGKLITLAALSYTGGNFNFLLARPDATDEAMLGASNTKFVARFYGAITFSGVQTLQITAYGNTAAEISGEVVIDFDQLLTTDTLTSDYTASTRLISNRDIINLNGSYTGIAEIKDTFRLVVGTDAKNAKINSTIEELVFFKPLPVGKYLNIGGLFYSGTTVNIQIWQSDDKITKGTLWLAGSGVIGADNKCLVVFDGGYATLKMDYYYPTNTGAAVLGDDATYTTRGINSSLIKLTTLDSAVYPRYPNQFVDVTTFSLPLDYLQRSVKLYIKGTVANTDYYLLSVFYWALVSGKYRLIYQIKKMTLTTDALPSGLIVYSSYMEFDAIEDIKGSVTRTLTPINGHPYEAQLDIDFTFLAYRTDYDNATSPYTLNKTGATHATKGFNVNKLQRDSASRFASSGGGLTKYASLKEAIALAESEVFSIGGNLFKSKIAVPLVKSDIACINNPAKLMNRKPKKKEYDFYYKAVKTRLEIIDSEDNFYFVNLTSIVKTPHAMKQTWTVVANTAAADLVVYDVAAGIYYSIPTLTELFTATSMGVTYIGQARLTYDEELFIITLAGGNTTISITESNQTALRTFDFNGTTTTKYSFGAGVNVVKDWSMTHHKDVMFVSDYDLGVSGVRGTTGGQKCYVSTDNGYTFTECFDFTGSDWSNVTNAANITSFGAASAHIHAVVYDPKQSVAWIITGDGAVSNDNSSLFWSRDLGATWTHMRSTITDSGALIQQVIAVPFDGCIAFGTDASFLNGTTVITYDGENMVQETTKQHANKVALLCFARSVWARETSKVKYMSFGKDSQQTADPDAYSFILASSNGYTWETVWEDNNAAIYGNVFCYDDTDGKVYISLDGTGSYKERVVVLNVGFV